MYHRIQWWALSLLLLSLFGVRSEDTPECPCVPTELCSNPSEESPEACNEAQTVRCCHTTQQSHMPQEIAEHLNQERQLMSAINNLLENMTVTNTQSKSTNSEDIGQREEKSIGVSTDNGFKYEKECNNDSKESSISEIKLSSPRNSTTDKLIIVYGETPSKNNMYFEDKINPHIVLATKMEDSSQSDISSLEKANDNKPQESMKVEVSTELSTEQNSQNKFKDDISIIARKPIIHKEKLNIHKLFPKRRPLPFHSKTPLENLKKDQISENMDVPETLESENEDLVEAGSDIQEIKTRGPLVPPTNMPSPSVEQENIKKLPFRSPPRRLLPQPIKNEEVKQMGKNVLDLLKENSKGRLTLKPIKIKGDNKFEPDQSIAAFMDEMNVKTLNSIMKTNFASSILQSDAQQISAIEDQVFTGNMQPGAEHDNSKSAEERGQVRPPQRGTHRVRPQRIKPSNTASISQEAFDTTSNKEIPNQELSKRQQLLRRSRVRPQVNSQSAEEEKTNVQEQNTPSVRYDARRLRPRLRTTKSNENMNNRAEEPKLPLYSEIKSNNPQPLLENDDVGKKSFVEKDFKSNQDLEGSGTDFEPQFRQSSSSGFESQFQGSSGIDFEQFQPKEKFTFTPPENMESGFQPMLHQPRNLHIIGPRPTFSKQPHPDDIGLEPPTFDYQFEFGKTQPRKHVNDQKLLPPIFTPETQTSFQMSQFSNVENRFPDLLPPLQAPVPLNENVDGERETTPPPKVLNIDHERDFTKLHEEFSNLNTKYNMLLNKYATTLNLYSDKYKEVLS